MNQDVLAMLLTAFGKSRILQTYVITIKQATKQHEGVCPFTSRLTKQVKCVSLLDINIDDFSSVKLHARHGK